MTPGAATPESATPGAPISGSTEVRVAVGVRDAAPRTGRYEATRIEVERVLAEWREPRYRATQVWDVMYGARRPLEESSALPRALRDRLAARFPLSLTPLTAQTSTDAATRKWLWAAGPDGAQVETVLMEYPSRATVCVSSQAGCAMGCTFCATGQEGFERHLSRGEIVEQVLRAQHATARPVTNVVFMGMGEPLANYDAVVGALDRLHDDLGLSARRLVVSTVGVVPGMRRLAGERLPVTLAVSLHAPDDALRNTLVPLNRRYPIAAVIEAARQFGSARGRRVTFEYAAIAGVNDGSEQARGLVKLLAPLGPLGSHVNVIPLNATGAFAGGPPTPRQLDGFASILRAGGLSATVRRNRGGDIDAACGQLRSRGGSEPGGPLRSRGGSEHRPTRARGKNGQS